MDLHRRSKGGDRRRDSLSDDQVKTKNEDKSKNLNLPAK